jgi:hypothetical protein
MEVAMSRRAYAIVEVAVSVAIVAVSVGIRVRPPRIDQDQPSQEIHVQIDTDQTERENRSVPLPLPGRIVTQEEFYNGDHYRGEIAWIVTEEELPLLCRALEKRRPIPAYTVQAVGADRWEVCGAFDSTDRNGVGASPDPSWIARLSPLFGAEEPIPPPSAPPPPDAGATHAPGSSAIDEEATPVQLQVTGGSGGVRFEQRGTMQWLWDDTVLRLEPAR